MLNNSFFCDKITLGGDWVTKDNYTKMLGYFETRQRLLQVLKALYKGLPLIVFVSYPVVLLIYLINHKGADTVFLKIFLVPLCTFLAVSVFRNIFNFERPYEKFATPPLIAKDKKGKSFPSRHVASAFIITMALLYLNTIVGIVFFAISILIACTRVFAGVHFVRDVLTSAVFSIVVGYVFIFLI